MSPTVLTQTGSVQGLARGDHLEFRGIPYARPPIDALRFQPPAPCVPWTGVRDATRFANVAMQGEGFAPGTEVEGEQSEDCLYLNVYTRAVGQRKRPVMVWIHGGAFTVGASSVPLYDGGPLVELGDVVVVSFNYRLGSFGFLFFGEDAARLGVSHNLALRDQVAALRWVRDNITAFGGDPDNVTLFGESAGASSVCALLIAPSAQGLFQRAISQSSALPPTFPRPESATRITDRLLQKLDLPRAELGKLLTLPAQTISKAQRAMENEGLLGTAFFLVHDDDSLPGAPRDVLSSSARPRVPLLIGSNRDEWNLFDAPNIVSWDKPLSDDDALTKLRRRFVTDEAARHALQVYRDTRATHSLRHDNRALLRAIEGDARFRIPSLRYAELYARDEVPTFMYLFSYASPALRGVLGACHALDLPFVFGTLSARGQDRFAGTGAQAQALSQAMMQCWLRFAERGEPGFAPYAPPARPTMVFDLQSTLVEDPLGAERAVWEGVL